MEKRPVLLATSAQVLTLRLTKMVRTTILRHAVSTQLHALYKPLRQEIDDKSISEL